MTNNKITLREIVASDIHKIFEGLSHPEVIKHYGVHFSSLEATETQMKWFEEPSQKWFVICSADTDEFYGACGFNAISTLHKKAEVGLWLLPHHWGKGIMKIAMPLLCRYGFESLQLHRIEGFVESENVNCKKALSKLDFEFEGTLRDCELKNGRFISVDIYAILATEKDSDD